MKIAIGSDHRGEEMKRIIITYLESKNIEIIDYSKTNDSEDDYPDIAFKLGNDVAKDSDMIGILICGSGIGMSIAANKVKGIRCAKVDSVKDAILARGDNGANIMAFSSSKSIQDALTMVDAFINADFLTAERHKRRMNKIIDYENGAYNEL